MAYLKKGGNFRCGTSSKLFLFYYVFLIISLCLFFGKRIAKFRQRKKRRPGRWGSTLRCWMRVPKLPIGFGRIIPKPPAYTIIPLPTDMILLIKLSCQIMQHLPWTLSLPRLTWTPRISFFSSQLDE